jgi:hypothetical protein
MVLKCAGNFAIRRKRGTGEGEGGGGPRAERFASSGRSLYWTSDAVPGRQGGTPLFGIEDALVEFARDLYDAVSWPGVIFLMAIESACIPFPSEVIMPLAGWFLVKDRGHGLEYLLLAGFFGALGSTIGSLVAYYGGLIGGGHCSSSTAVMS